MNYLSHISCILVMLTSVNDKSLTIKSPAFKHNELIPSTYTCDGSNISPALSIEDMPANTRSLAIVMDDPDAPKGTFDHWVMWNIHPSSTIAENSTPGTQGRNGKGENKYTGPCPPSGTHHYHFKVYALDTELSLTAGADKKALEKAMEGHIVAQGELIGKYKRK
jgi:Raf kinase inhibitor-like YbhB/YbcL family protein